MESRVAAIGGFARRAEGAKPEDIDHRGTETQRRRNLRGSSETCERAGPRTTIAENQNGRCRIRRGGPSARPRGRSPRIVPLARPPAFGRPGGPRARPYECGEVRSRFHPSSRALPHSDFLNGFGAILV